MRCPKCESIVPAGARACEKCGALTPRGKREKAQAAHRLEAGVGDAMLESIQIERDAEGRLQLRPWHVTLALAVILSGVVYGAYRLTAYMFWASSPERTAPESIAIELVKNSPSQKAGVTIDAYLSDLVKRRQEKMELEEIEGWRVESGLGQSWEVYFSYEDLRGFYEAHWTVNVEQKQVRPANEEARLVTGRPVAGP